jgi:molybdenum cofactor biosynthesis enzyme MoaA
MSWSCPHLINDKCDLNNTRCVPTKGQCVLKGKYLTAEQLAKLTEMEQGTGKKDNEK